MSGTLVSPAAAYSNTAFNDAEKADIRRFCGYPLYGSGESSFNSWRFFQAYGLLEYRMNNMAPAEYQNARYIATQLYTLESAIWGASANLDTDLAAVWTHNRAEVSDRERLYSLHRRRLCSLVGIPPGPELKNGSSFDVVI